MTVIAVGLFAFISNATSDAAAELETVGEGDEMRLVREQFTTEQQVRYDLFAEKCTRCHAMARPIAALQTGITPVSFGNFDAASMQRYVIRMMRKPNSGVDRDSAREIIIFLRYARTLAQESSE